ncbi:RNase adapter RapZ [Thermosyntropha sp.]|uniref:RNase adapter RapZ n=1 Tax=Thermosyntropha sp. TaxID=2740820 RepID=UPI0025CF6790|nr:RNase adapter RapZ [Thermosyntropha sp.]MBO8159007.1 RNase adapter RapZ [Thermosyntropha sp.]
MPEVKEDEIYILIITGLSGAGKTQAVNCLEDAGYYCVDNLPPVLLRKFIELIMDSERKIDRIALVLDVRGGQFFDQVNQVIEELGRDNIRLEILFLEASDEVLVRRFKESRRRHPLAVRDRLLEAIERERQMLEELRGRANFIIDTSNLTPRELKDKIISLLGENKKSRFTVGVMSFGYKMGIPLDSDIVMDVRFLPNPFYDPVMRDMTGEDELVADFVLSSPVTKSFTRRFLNMLRFLIPYYIEEGKTNLEIALGCTGGQHRSVVLADYIGKQLRNMGYNVNIRHRDIFRYKVEE